MPAIPSPLGDYPEIFSEARHYPTGRLDDFQRHKVRLWGTYVLGVGALGDVGISGLWRVESGRTYSLRSANRALSATQLGLGSGYASLPISQTIYFGERGSESFAGYGAFDMALSYEVPVFKSLRPWIKLEVYNLFKNEKLIRWNTTVTPDPNSPLDELGLRTGYIEGPNFGKSEADTNFPRPFVGQTGGRYFQVAAGFKF